MKPLFLLCILFFVLTGFSQNNKIYLTAKGKICTDPKKAASFVLIEKLNDSLYQILTYDMQNNLMIKGTYKDTAMKIPDGKFWYYGKIKYYSINDKGVKTELNNPDTNNYVLTTGTFLNGMKTGIWINYFDHNIKSEMFTYKNDKLNGLYQEYDANSGNVHGEGNFVNGKKEGEWNSYRGSMKPFSTDIYSHNQIVKTILHDKNPIAPPVFDKYIQRALESCIDTLKSMGIVVGVFITDKGKVDSLISSNIPLSRDTYQLVRDVLLKSPTFEPAIQDDKPIGQIYYYNFRFGSSYNRELNKRDD